ncbi:hypothetical protein P9314_15160 [Paenibacillus validus]|uniref:PaaD-like zinc ribbon domain-containing protein n=1 Tax=Paenibacillus TaxID=44249 RepID=UPI0013DFE51A|nr:MULTISPECIES: hypothetical protein [Paenibacillus]MED4602034.1 hypothetical protein [Paenibacillus validus]MED4607301.1 hypothetical protein [Paenibacillus validus]
MVDREERCAEPFCCFCESKDVTLIAPFGTAQLVRQYYCNACKSVFEFVRWQEEHPDES